MSEWCTCETSDFSGVLLFLMSNFSSKSNGWHLMRRLWNLSSVWRRWGLCSEFWLWGLAFPDNYCCWAPLFASPLAFLSVPFWGYSGFPLEDSRGAHPGVKFLLSFRVTMLTLLSPRLCVSSWLGCGAQPFGQIPVYMLLWRYFL